MKSLTTAIAICLLVGGSIQASTRQQQEQPQPPELTARGCVTAGGDTGTFVLTNAVIEAGSIKGTNVRFRLIPDTGVELKPHLNHLVRVTGVTQGKVPPPGQTVPESDLPTLRIHTLKMVSSECLNS